MLYITLTVASVSLSVYIFCPSGHRMTVWDFLPEVFCMREPKRFQEPTPSPVFFLIHDIHSRSLLMPSNSPAVISGV